MLRVFSKIQFVLTILLALPTYAQDEASPDRYVGRAGDIYISEKEFLQRFEMLPALYRNRKPQLDVAKMELMYSLIAEKLLAQEAQNRKLDQDSVFQHALLEVRKLLARDELYRQEISNKVEISPKELTVGIKQAQKQTLLAFLFFDLETDARFVRGQMKEPKDFDELAMDTVMNVLRDTATVIWGDANLAVEAAAYALKVGDISPVVKAGDGYYILKCMATRPNTFYSSMPPNVLRERVLRTIRQQKEKVLMDKFLSTAFENKIGYSRPKPFKVLAQSVMDVYTQQLQPFDSTISMNAEYATLIRTAVGSTVNDTLVVVGNASWSVNEVIERLLVKGFTVKRENIKKIPASLNGEIGFWVQQELLGQEAIARRLDQQPDVQGRLETWNQAYLAEMMKEYARKNTHVSDEEVWAYLQHQDKQFPIPHVQIRELRTSTLDEMKQALDDMERGMSFEQVIEKRSNDSEAKKDTGLSKPFAITERSPLGNIASQMDVGQRYGPIRLKDGVHFFELVAKKADEAIADTALAAKKERAAKELFAMKQKRTLTLFISQVAEKRGFDIYQDRLLKLEVTPIPMMTFRFLGFGGRMFEVPFVDPQLQWLDVEPPKETVLP